MSEHEDPLSREVAIAARLDDTGLSLHAKSRAVAALDRLVGSIADWPAAFFEGKAEKQRVKDRIQQRLMLAQPDAEERKLAGTALEGDQFHVRMIEQEARKQENLAGVAIEATLEMKALPPPAAPTSDRVENSSKQIDDDWLNQFTRYAEDASSDELQKVWGRVLAGEVNRPGSFSRLALRFISELDQETAQNCEYAVERAFTDFIPKTPDWLQDKGMLTALDLQRLGLIEGVTGVGGMRQSFTFNENPMPFMHGEYCLLVRGEAGETISVDAIVITRLGKEIFSLLAPTDHRLALRELTSLLARSEAVSRIELGKWQAEGARVLFFMEEVLFEREKA